MENCNPSIWTLLWYPCSASQYWSEEGTSIPSRVALRRGLVFWSPACLVRGWLGSQPRTEESPSSRVSVYYVALHQRMGSGTCCMTSLSSYGYNHPSQEYPKCLSRWCPSRRWDHPRTILPPKVVYLCKFPIFSSVQGSGRSELSQAARQTSWFWGLFRFAVVPLSPPSTSWRL